LAAGATSVAADGDLEGGASAAWRIVEGPTGSASRFLNVIGVAGGAAPDVAATRVTSDGGVDVVATAGAAVTFAKSALGTTALPFSYQLPASPGRMHVLCNLDAAVDVAVAQSGGTTKVTVSAGAQQTPS